MTCLGCGPDDAPGGDAGVGPPSASGDAVEKPGPPTPVAGASAVREYERRKAKREEAIRTRHPRLGGLILFLSDEPASTTAWAKGAVGERKLGAGLDGLVDAGVVALHDRRIPGSKANIDHIAVTPAGVWVIDAKRYSGQVAKRDGGGWFSTDLRLYVGRRDCTKLIGVMAKQVTAVRAALGDQWAEVPVRPVLCFVDGEWGFFSRSFELDGVLVAWPKATRELLTRPGPYTP
ncbi:MAG: NERD domain-containing protein [Actinomycetota bacterium]|nr:NERD domain-containing protein [Actinomycetota bacterium]